MKVRLGQLKKFIKKAMNEGRWDPKPGSYTGKLEGWESSDGRVFNVEFEYYMDSPDPGVGYGGGVVETYPTEVVEIDEEGNEHEIDPNSLEGSLSQHDWKSLESKMYEKADELAREMPYDAAEYYASTNDY